MKRILIISTVLFSVAALYFGFAKKSNVAEKTKTSFSWIKDGDILFQDTGGDFGEAIKLATKSKYSHCGMAIKEGTNILVFEAIGPVKYTPISEWINNGIKKSFSVYRLKDSKIVNDALLKLWRAKAASYMGKEYDHVFGWNDEKIYCSELIWKMYNAAGIKLSIPKQLKDFDLTHVLVRQQLKKRYGDKIPYEEQVVSPQDLVESSLLSEVKP